MTVWITKYALTSGLIEVKAKEVCPEAVEVKNGKWRGSWFWGNDWHTTKEAAIAKAEEMREKKIKSLRKQLEKLEKMRFEDKSLN